METFCATWMREAALGPLATREISLDGPPRTTSKMENRPSLKMSWVRGETSAPWESRLKVEPKAQRKLGCLHSAFSNAELFCEQPGIPEAKDKPGLVRLVHQTPNAKRKGRVKAVNFFKARFTKLIITLYPLKVNPYGYFSMKIGYLEKRGLIFSQS